MADYLCFSVRRLGETTVVDITQKELSEFDFQEQLRDELTDLVSAAPSGRFIVNLAGVEMIGSHAIGVLVEARKNVHHHGGQVMLCGVNPQVRLSFQVLNLDGTLFKIFDSEAEALSACD
jgi:anti-anti-sigma factor